MTKKGYHVNVNLPVQIIKEGKVFVAYCPVLDIATQGDTYEEAQEMFNELVRVFIDDLIERGTFEKVLLDLGWKKSSHGRRWELPERQFINETHQEVSIPCPV